MKGCDNSRGLDSGARGQMCVQKCRTGFPLPSLGGSGPTYMCTSPGIRHTLLGRFLSPAESATVRVHFVAGGTEAR